MNAAFISYNQKEKIRCPRCKSLVTNYFKKEEKFWCDICKNWTEEIVKRNLEVRDFNFKFGLVSIGVAFLILFIWFLIR